MQFLYLVLLLIFFFTGSCGAVTASSTLQVEKDMSGRHEKIDPALLVELQQLKEEGEANKEIEVLIRTSGEVDETQRVALEKAGLKVNSTMKDILTGSVEAKSVEALAELKFISYIEKSKKQRLR